MPQTTPSPPVARIASPKLLHVFHSSTLHVTRFSAYTLHSATPTPATPPTLSLAVTDDNTSRSYAITLPFPFPTPQPDGDALVADSAALPPSLGRIYVALPSAALCQHGTIPLPLPSPEPILQHAPLRPSPHTPRLALPIPAGALAATASPTGSTDDTALLAVSISGVVRVLPALPPERVAATLSAPAAPPPVAKLQQEPVLAAVSHNAQFCIVIGALGGCQAVTAASSPDATEPIAQRFHLPTPGPPHSAASISIGYPTPSTLLISCVENGAFVSVTSLPSSPQTSSPSSTPSASPLIISSGRRASPCSPLLPAATTPEPHQISSSLRRLLRDIDAASTRRDLVLRAASRADAALASLNAATSFALAANADPRGLGVRAQVLVVDADSVAAAPGPLPWAGARAQVVVRLTSEAAVDLGDGWCVQLRVRVRPPEKPFPPALQAFARRPAGGGATGGDGDGGGVSEGIGVESSLPGDGGASKEGEEGVGDKYRALNASIVQTMALPLGKLLRGATRDYPFAVDLKSHAPIRACVSLVFHRLRSEDLYNSVALGASSSSLSPDGDAPAEAILRVGLLSQRRVDILDLSSAVAEDDLREDSSHLLLPNARISAFLDPRRARRQQPSVQTSTRVDVPLETGRIADALWGWQEGQKQRNGTQGVTRSTEEEPSEPEILAIRRRTPMGGIFECELARESSGKGTVITMRGARHVLPFVRGAVLRRVADVLDTEDSDGSHDGSEKSGDEKMDVDAESIEAQPRAALDQRKVLDAVDAAELELRKADSHLVEVHRWLHEVTILGRLDSCIGGYDKESCRNTLTSLWNAYDGWREASASFWG